MERSDILEEIKTILIDVLNHEDFQISEQLSANDVDGWDSLTHMVIVTRVENRFGIKFKLRELSKLENIKSLIDLIQSKL